MLFPQQAGTQFLFDVYEMQLINLVTPRWCVDKGECWERIVDYWCSEEYREKNLDYKNRRAAMEDPPHHQGSLNLKGFGQCWVCLSSHRFVLHKLFLVIHVANPYDEVLIMLLWLQASHNKAPEPNLFVAYALAHKGSFRSATPYDENDTLPAYTSKTA